jgi:hypothetical protein
MAALDHASRCVARLSIRLAARLPAPREHLLRSEPMLASNFRNHRARYERLFNDPRLVILRGPATSLSP